MKPLLYLAACVGAAVMALSLAGALGIGHFRLYYGAASGYWTVYGPHGVALDWSLDAALVTYYRLALRTMMGFWP